MLAKMVLAGTLNAASRKTTTRMKPFVDFYTTTPAPKCLTTPLRPTSSASALRLRSLVFKGQAFAPASDMVLPA
jgi:hypothetical protein